MFAWRDGWFGGSLLCEEIIQWSWGSLFAEGKSLLTLTEWDRVGRGEVVLERMCVYVCVCVCVGRGKSNL